MGNLQKSTGYLLRVHLPGIISSCIAKQNECRVCFSLMLFVKVPQHKIHSCSTSCAVQLAEPNCCTEMQMQQVFRISCDDGEAPTCCASRTNDYIGDVSSLALVFVPFFQLTVSSARSLAV